MSKLGCPQENLEEQGICGVKHPCLWDGDGDGFRSSPFCDHADVILGMELRLSNSNTFFVEKTGFVTFLCLMVGMNLI
jgi:hypothetical protein